MICGFSNSGPRYSEWKAVPFSFSRCPGFVLMEGKQAVLCLCSCLNSSFITSALCLAGASSVSSPNQADPIVYLSRRIKVTPTVTRRKATLELGPESSSDFGAACQIILSPGNYLPALGTRGLRAACRMIYVPETSLASFPRALSPESCSTWSD